MTTQEIGTIGEEIAGRFLQSFGYRLYDANVRLGHDEIDIVAFDPAERSVVFVEVKTRASADPDFVPELNLTSSKRAHLARGAQAWVDQHAYEGSYRIDAILIVGDDVVEHLKDIGNTWI